MNIGISSMDFSTRPFLDSIDAIEGHFDLWEIVMEGEHSLRTIRTPLFDILPRTTLEFSIHAPCSDLNIASVNPAVRRLSIRMILDVIEFAAEAGILRVTFHPGHFSPLGKRVPERVAKLNHRALARIGDHAAEFGVVAAVENMPYPGWTCGNSAEELVSMIDESGVAICFDIGHAHINDQLDEMLNLADRIVNVHLHDNHGDRDEHLALGEGTVPYERVLEPLQERYRGDIILEMRSIEDGVSSKERLAAVLEQ